MYDCTTECRYVSDVILVSPSQYVSLLVEPRAANKIEKDHTHRRHEIGASKYLP